MVSLTSWALSDVGRKRPNNEDCFFKNDGIGLYMVADGMGGHRGGDKASRLAIDAVMSSFNQSATTSLDPAIALEKAVQAAALQVFEEGKRYPELHGMGTTLSTLAIKDNYAFICHVGDSRVYHIRNKMIKQLTCDHSLVNEQVQAGIMRPEEARSSTLRNIITRAIGHNPSVRADNLSLPIALNDIFLLCTDGLNGMVLDENIISIINTLKPEIAIQKLIDESNKKGGEDNITVVLVSINP